MTNDFAPNPESCGYCPQFCSSTGCADGIDDIRNCCYIDRETHAYDQEICEINEQIEEPEPNLPITLALAKREFEKMVDNSQCKADPDYDLEKHLEKLGLLSQDKPADEILIIDCPHCGAASYYDGGFTDTCSCCGYYNLADFSDDAYTLMDYWEEPDSPPF